MEQTIGYAVGVIICVIAVYWFIDFLGRMGKEQDTEENTDEVDKNTQAAAEEPASKSENPAGQPEELATRKLLIQTLTTLNCHYSERDEATVCFTYQGENFLATATDDSVFVSILDPWWFTMPKSGDIEDFAKMRRAVNYVNSLGGCCTFYTFDDEEDLIVLNTSLTILFLPEIRSLDKYLTSILDAFFTTKHNVLNEMAKLGVKVNDYY